jgi:hypothetical protein
MLGVVRAPTPVLISVGVLRLYDLKALPMPAKRLFCYVDESGQDTQGELFVVSVVITDEEREALINICEEIERQSGKGRVKWSKARHPQRLAYLQQVLRLPQLQGKLYFGLYHETLDYLSAMIRTIALAISAAADAAEVQATVRIDGLPASQVQLVGSRLHRAGVRLKKVRGVKRDENDALIRLADALCGLVRAADADEPVLRDLFARCLRQGAIRDISGQ